MIDQLPNTAYDKEILKEGGVGELAGTSTRKPWSSQVLVGTALGSES